MLLYVVLSQYVVDRFDIVMQRIINSTPGEGKQYTADKEPYTMEREQSANDNALSHLHT